MTASVCLTWGRSNKTHFQPADWPRPKLYHDGQPQSVGQWRVPNRGRIVFGTIGPDHPNRPDIVLINNGHIVEIAAVITQGINGPGKIMTRGVQGGE